MFRLSGTLLVAQLSCVMAHLAPHVWHAFIDLMWFSWPCCQNLPLKGRTFQASLSLTAWFWILGLSLFHHLARSLSPIKARNQGTQSLWSSTQKASRFGKITSSAWKKLYQHGREAFWLPLVRAPRYMIGQRAMCNSLLHPFSWRTACLFLRYSYNAPLPHS